MEIDALKASPAVQAMHPIARSGYVWLLLDAWQTDDCTIPMDPLDLADKSGLGDELWAVHGIRILRKFEPVNDGSDRLRNLPQYDRWQAAKAAYEGRKNGAQRTNERRSPQQSPTAKATVTDTVGEQSPSRSVEFWDSPPCNPPLRETERGREIVVPVQKQKPLPKSKSSVPTDERFAIFRQDYQTTFQFTNGFPAPWDGKEAGQLSRWLKKNPTITRVQWQAILRNRKISPINQKSELSRWIGVALAWIDSKADEWGKPINGGKNATISLGKADANLAVLEEVIAGRQRERAAGENGDLPAREVGEDEPRTIHAVPSSVGPSRLPSSDGDALGDTEGRGRNDPPITW